MAGSINKVILVGNLGSDPEVRRMQDNRPVVNLSIATSESWKDKNTGERREKTEWHRVVIFNEGLCRIAENYLKKGSKVYLEGSLQTRKWQDNNGNDKYSTEVVLQGFNGNLTMLDSRNGGGQQSQGQGQGGQNNYQQNDQFSGGGSNQPEWGQMPDNGGNDFGNNNSNNENNGNKGSGAPANFEKELDDEIPF